MSDGAGHIVSVAHSVWVSYELDGVGDIVSVAHIVCVSYVAAGAGWCWTHCECRTYYVGDKFCVWVSDGVGHSISGAHSVWVS